MNYTESKTEISRAEAVALYCAGVLPVMDAFIVESSGQCWETWFLRPAPEDATADSPEARAAEWLQLLRSDAPEHAGFPLRYALAAAENYARLTEWLGSPVGPVPCTPEVKGAVILETGGAGSGGDSAAITLRDVAYAAALAALGWRLSPLVRVLADGSPGFCFSAHSPNFPGLEMPALQLAAMQANAAGGDYSGVRVDGALPGEHPFCFAMAAVIAVSQPHGVRRLEAAGRKDPCIFWRARRSRRTALVSLSVEAEGSPFPDVKSEMKKHLR